jgi:hypothetical protein
MIIIKGVVFMKNEVKEFKIYITEFINAKDKKKKYDNFKDLLKDGLVTEYYFKYIVSNDPQKNVKTSGRIRKLDLYNKEAYTVNEAIKYKISNEI